MKKMKKRVAVSCYEFQIVGLERSKRGLRGRPTMDGTRTPPPSASLLEVPIQVKPLLIPGREWHWSDGLMGMRGEQGILTITRWNGER